MRRQGAGARRRLAQPRPHLRPAAADRGERRPHRAARARAPRRPRRGVRLRPRAVDEEAPAADRRGDAARAAGAFRQQHAIHRVLTEEGGYIPVGLDHYARPDDAMAKAATTRRLHRSFQGYTDDSAPALIGFGASAIGSLPQGYAQNAPTALAYEKAIAAGGLATVRGVALTPDDRLRRELIERLMCDLEVDVVALGAAHGADPRRWSPRSPDSRRSKPTVSPIGTGGG